MAFIGCVVGTAVPAGTTTTAWDVVNAPGAKPGSEMPESPNPTSTSLTLPLKPRPGLMHDGNEVGIRAGAVEVARAEAAEESGGVVGVDRHGRQEQVDRRLHLE